MVRTYKRKTDRVALDEEAVSVALKEVQESKIPARQAALKYGINIKTLYSRVKRQKATNSSTRFPVR